MVSRAVLQHFAARLNAVPDENGEAVTAIAVDALDRLKARVASFEEPDCLIREQLARLYMDDEEYISAATVLAGINLESGNKQYPDAEKASK